MSWADLFLQSHSPQYTHLCVCLALFDILLWHMQRNWTTAMWKPLLAIIWPCYCMQLRCVTACSFSKTFTYHGLDSYWAVCIAFNDTRGWHLVPWCCSPRYIWKFCPQYHFSCHISQIDCHGIERSSLWCEASNKLPGPWHRPAMSVRFDVLRLIQKKMWICVGFAEFVVFVGKKGSL